MLVLMGWCAAEDDEKWEVTPLILSQAPTGTAPVVVESARGEGALAYYRAYRRLLEEGRGFTEAVVVDPERVGREVGGRCLFDADGNAVLAEASLVDAKNCYVRANAGKLVALIGVEDLVVVDTEDALLIMPRERAQDVRRVVDDLSKRDAKKYL